MDEIQKKIESLILEIRGQQVMLDRDLAMLYDVETKQLNRQVLRNIERFPNDFMFQLNNEELINLKCQFGTSSWGGDRKLPYAFTENGIAMLSGILRSPTAISVNIQIMRAFTAMRHMFARSADVFSRIEAVEHNQLAMRGYVDKRFDQVLDKMEERSLPPRQGIFFNGQIFDAYAFVSGLIKGAKNSIVLIDNYIDESVLMLLDKRSKGVSATIYTKNIDKHLQLDIDKHNAQYSPIDVKVFQDSHDRFLIIDETVYHIGASIKDLGKKWFAFSKMEIGWAELMIKLI